VTRPVASIADDPAAKVGSEPAPPSAATPVPRASALTLIYGVVATALSVLYTVIVATTAALLVLVAGGHAVSWISRWWGRMILWTCGVKAQIEGLEHLDGSHPYILVCNHQSFFDIFAILAWLPGEPRFLAKQELRRIPVIGFVMPRAGHVMIDRARGGRSIRRAIESVREGYSIVVFAEGRRFSDNCVHPFNDGAAWLALATKLKCVPMAISGTANFFPRGARVVRPWGRMLMAIGSPIDTAKLRGADREALTHQLESAVRALFRSEV
jgi:1-acyl-sn-glycerol-3-phosphate acyltransferase